MALLRPNELNGCRKTQRLGMIHPKNEPNRIERFGLAVREFSEFRTTQGMKPGRVN
jgi:hypothetical protein